MNTNHCCFVYDKTFIQYNVYQMHTVDYDYDINTMCILGSPVIAKGSFVPIPHYSSIPSTGYKQVLIGAPVYVRENIPVLILCLTPGGTPPMHHKWFRNESPYISQGYQDYVALRNPQNGDVFNCTVTNHIGFDSAITTISVGGKWLMNVCMYAYICTYVRMYAHSHYTYDRSQKQLTFCDCYYQIYYVRTNYCYYKRYYSV